MRKLVIIDDTSSDTTLNSVEKRICTNYSDYLVRKFNDNYYPILNLCYDVDNVSSLDRVRVINDYIKEIDYVENPIVLFLEISPENLEIKDGSVELIYFNEKSEKFSTFALSELLKIKPEIRVSMNKRAFVRLTKVRAIGVIVKIGNLAQNSNISYVSDICNRLFNATAQYYEHEQQNQYLNH